MMSGAALVLLKPWVGGDAVVSLVEETLSRFSVSIADRGTLSAEQVARSGLMERHEGAIFGCDGDPESISLDDEAELAMVRAFDVTWDDVLRAGRLINAVDALERIDGGCTEAALDARWRNCTKQLVLLPTVIVAYFEEEDMYVINGHLPAQQLKLVEATAPFHWFAVEWCEDALSWRNLRRDVVGCHASDAADLPPGSVNSVLISEWEKYGLPQAPRYELGELVHVSRGPLEAMVERRTWIHRAIEDDEFGRIALLRGVNRAVLDWAATNPVTTLSEVTEPIFDHLEEVSTSVAVECLEWLNAANAVDPPEDVENVAFILLEPHASNEKVRVLVETLLKRVHGMEVVAQGTVSSEKIREKNLVDRHYGAFARHALYTRAKDLVLDDTAKGLFQAAFGMPWSQAVAAGRVCNAAEAAARFADRSAEEMHALWSDTVKESRNTARLGPNLTVTYFPDWQSYVVNVEYLFLRSRFCAPHATVSYMIVTWHRAAASWAEIARSIVGDAARGTEATGTLCHTLRDHWHDLDLLEVPFERYAGIQVSANTIEAIFWQSIWCGIPMESLSSVRAWHHWRGITAARLYELQLQATRAPAISVAGQLLDDDGAGGGRLPSCDGHQLEALAISEEIDEALRMPEARFSRILDILARAGERAVQPSAYDNNHAVLLLHPTVSASATAVDFVKYFLQQTGVQTVRQGELFGSDIARRHIVPQHYGRTAHFATCASLEELLELVASDQGSPGLVREESFSTVFGQSWAKCVTDGDVLCAEEACRRLQLSPEELHDEWQRAADSGELVQLTDDVAVARVASLGVFIVNGFFPLAHATLTHPARRVCWLEISWNRRRWSWSDLAARVIGVHPAAVEGTLWATLRNNCATLELPEERGDVSARAVPLLTLSAGPLDAVIDRLVWTTTDADLSMAVDGHASLPPRAPAAAVADLTLANDPLCQVLLANGVPLAAIRRCVLETCPWEGVKTCAHEHCHVRKQLQGLSTGEVINALRALVRRSRCRALENNAVIVVKPQVVTSDVEHTIVATLAANGISVVSSNCVGVQTVAVQKLMEQHQRARYQNAMELEASQLLLSDAMMAQFERAYGISWRTALELHLIINAAAASKRYGEGALAEMWSAAPLKLCLSANLYVARFEEDGLFVVNGFYLLLRSKLLSGLRVQCFTVTWDERMLSWDEFHDVVVGNSNPVEARGESIRGRLLIDWKQLGLEQPPNGIENGLEVSSSPLEAMFHRRVWLGTAPEDDQFVQFLQLMGLSQAFIEALDGSCWVTTVGGGPAGRKNIMPLLEYVPVDPVEAAQSLLALQGSTELTVSKPASEAPVPPSTTHDASTSPRHYALLLLMPQVNAGLVPYAVRSLLQRHNIRVDVEGELDHAVLRGRRAFERQFHHLLPALACATPPGQSAGQGDGTNVALDSEECERLTAAFGPECTQGKLRSAGMAVLAEESTAKEERSLWESSPHRVRISERLYVAEVVSSAEREFRVNGFALADLDDFYAGTAAPARYMCVSWPESVFGWDFFTERIIGSADVALVGRESELRTVSSLTSSAAAAAPSIQVAIQERWQELGLTRRPSGLNGAIHASPSALHALRSKRLWLGTSSAMDGFGYHAGKEGVSSRALFAAITQLDSADAPDGPVANMVGATSGIADLLRLEHYFAQQSASMSGLPRESAFVVVKAHASHQPFHRVVEAVFAAHNVHVDMQGDISSDAIDRSSIADIALLSSATYAVLPLSRLRLSEKEEHAVRSTFGATWTELLESGTLINTSDVSRYLPGYSPELLYERWKAAGTRLCLRDSLEIAELKQEAIFVVNGYYPYLRQQLAWPGVTLHWYVVSWAPAEGLTWSAFHERVVGAADPAVAVGESIRGRLFADWKGLSLAGSPGDVLNGVHASVSPYQAFLERVAWLNLDLAEDSLGDMLLRRDVSREVIQWSLANPSLTVGRDHDVSMADYCASTNTAELVSLLQTLSRSSVGDAASVPKRQPQAAVPVEPRIPARRNDAVIVVKPHAATPEAQALILRVLRSHGVSVDRVHTVTGVDVVRSGMRLVDRQYATLCAYAAGDAAASRVLVPREVSRHFSDTFGEQWEDVLKSGRVLNCTQACARFGLSALQLYVLWVLGEPSVQLGFGLHACRFPVDDVYLINGFYPLLAEEMPLTPSEMVCLKVSWDEDQLSWASFQSDVVGCTNPANAAPGSVRGQLLQHWVQLRLLSRPCTLHNGIHSSSGPLEGYHDRQLWFPDHTGADPLLSAMEHYGGCAELLEYWSNDISAGGNVEHMTAVELMDRQNTSYAVRVMCKLGGPPQASPTESAGPSSWSMAAKPTSASAVPASRVKQRLHAMLALGSVMDPSSDVQRRPLYPLYAPGAAALGATTATGSRDASTTEEADPAA